MNLNKFAYTALVAFVSIIATLLMVSALHRSPANAQTAAPAKGITLEELARHDHRDSCWKAIDGMVYDLTAYIPDHPSSEEVLLAWCGRVSDEAWLNKRPGRPHSRTAEAMLANYLIGPLVGKEVASLPVPDRVEPVSTDAPRSAPAVTPGRAIPSAAVMLGLAPGTYLDGRYRGIFADGAEMQVGVQFDLREGRIHDLQFRQLAYRGVDYRGLTESDALHAVLLQHRQLAERLEGRPLSAIFDLYEPQHIVDDIDGYTGATLRGNKVISAIRDGLNRGVYQWR